MGGFLEPEPKLLAVPLRALVESPLSHTGPWEGYSDVLLRELLRVW